MPYGDGPYHICGTVTGIPDGAKVQVSVSNYWYISGPPASYGNSGSTVEATVIGGAFVTTDTYYFYVEGYFSVGALYQGISDSDIGQVSAAP